MAKRGVSVPNTQFCTWSRFVQSIYCHLAFELHEHISPLTRIGSPLVEQSAIQILFRALVIATYRNLSWIDEENELYIPRA